MLKHGDPPSAAVIECHFPVAALSAAEADYAAGIHVGERGAIGWATIRFKAANILVRAAAVVGKIKLMHRQLDEKLETPSSAGS